MTFKINIMFYRRILEKETEFRKTLFDILRNFIIEVQMYQTDVFIDYFVTIEICRNQQ
jgi:hypothetical protein